MNFGFEVTTDDVQIVMESHNINDLTDDQIQEIYDNVLDFDAIEASALAEFDMDKQTEQAHMEIWNQIQSHIETVGITW